MDTTVQESPKNPRMLRPWHPRGYPKLAHLMGSYPESAIFRRFGQLNMLNLLSYQAELIDLEAQYFETCEEDDLSDDARLNGLSSDFYLLHNSTRPNDVQRQLLEEIRLKLKEYSRFGSGSTVF